MRGLSEKAVIIAGGLGDLGFASEKPLAEEGCSAALLDRKLIGGRALSIGRLSWEVDILDESAIQNVCESVMERLGLTSILLNAAALFVLKGIEATS